MKYLYSDTANRLSRYIRYVLLLGFSGLASTSFAQNFAPASTYPTGTTDSPDGVAVGDVNGDGRVDIVTADSFGNEVSVVLGLTSGGFGPPTSYIVGSLQAIPMRVALGDVNGDGRLDIVTANANANAVAVLLGLPAGGFAPAVAYSTGAGSSPQDVVLGDLNNDGRLDVVTANFSTSTVGVLLGLPGGGFAPVSSYSTGRGSAPKALVLIDMNGDGRLDVVTANYSSSTIGLLLGQVGGSFTAVSTFSTGTTTLPEGVAVGDMNGDGQLDVVVGGNPTTNTIGLLLGLANGSFMPATSYSSGAGNGQYGLGDVAIGDVNGDGRPDVVASITRAFGENGVGILLGQANGLGAPTTYATHVRVPGMASRPAGVRIVDVNGDGRKDIVTPNNYLSTVAVLLNTGPALSATSMRPTAADITLYPNPTHGDFSVLSRVEIVKAELLNALGQVVPCKVLGTQASKTSLRIETDKLPTGVYTVRLQIEGALLIKQVIVE